MSVKKLAIIQARMSSSRLPGKVMMDIAGRPMLQRVFERATQAQSIDEAILATTTDPSDDLLEHFCHELGVPCYRGSLPDVLDRFYQAALKFHADVIIRLTADCPLLDPTLVDRTVATFLGEVFLLHSPDSSHLPNNPSESTFPFDFAANRLPPPWKRTLPIGLDVEVCSFGALERAWREADQLFHREHVMPYIYEGVSFPQSIPTLDMEWYIDQAATPRGFRVVLLHHNPDYGTLRWTVDTPTDLDFVRQVYSRFDGQPEFGWDDVLALLEREPGLASINADIQHKSVFDVDHRTALP
jgi:spore coat polysaccharide biosynthesis protein SpsF